MLNCGVNLGRGNIEALLAECNGAGDGKIVIDEFKAVLMKSKRASAETSPR